MFASKYKFDTIKVSSFKKVKQILATMRTYMFLVQTICHHAIIQFLAFLYTLAAHIRTFTLLITPYTVVSDEVQVENIRFSVLQ